MSSGVPAVRRHAGRIRIGFRAELDATTPLEPGEKLLLEWRIGRGGPWTMNAGLLRLTDRRVFILAGRWFGRNTILEIPRSLVRVRPAPVFDPVIRLEVAAPVDDDLLAFRANDWVVPPRARGITLRIHAESARTTQLRELLVLALGSAGDTPGGSGYG